MTGPATSVSATSVYVHFPWCLKKCPYCDFATRKIDRPDVPHGAYADAVLRELEARRDALTGRRLVSVFFGGGTPSLWSPAELGRVLGGIRGAFATHDPDVEVTVECNPSSLDRRRVADLREVGVDRLSIGVQSLSDERLRFLGRFHDSATALRVLDEARDEMPRVSADLMFGMPGQSPAAFADEIERVLDRGVRHVSAYSLTIEPGTQFGEMHRKGRLPIAPEEHVAEMFERAHEVFTARRFEQYEVSNYAAPAEESRHNQHYWRGGSYLGLGAAAVGCLAEGPGAARRYRNAPEGFGYMRGEPESDSERLGSSEILCEALMLGLRTSEGVDLAAAARRAGVEDACAGRERAIARRRERGDLELDGARMWVPRDRWLHLDSIVADLF